MIQSEIERPHPSGMGGIQKIYRFQNGYGASVIQFPFSRGKELNLYELAVIKFNPELPEDWGIVYDTPITDDVIGYLSDLEVDELLNKISLLPS